MVPFLTSPFKGKNHRLKGATELLAHCPQLGKKGLVELQSHIPCFLFWLYIYMIWYFEIKAYE
jgi:hypothetical protein